MSLQDEIILQTLAGYAVLALLISIPFGLWQNSWLAGIFMFFFSFMLQGNSK